MVNSTLEYCSSGFVEMVRFSFVSPEYSSMASWVPFTRQCLSNVAGEVFCYGPHSLHEINWIKLPLESSCDIAARSCQRRNRYLLRLECHTPSRKYFRLFLFASHASSVWIFHKLYKDVRLNLMPWSSEASPTPRPTSSQFRLILVVHRASLVSRIPPYRRLWLSTLILPRSQTPHPTFGRHRWTLTSYQVWRNDTSHFPSHPQRHPRFPISLLVLQLRNWLLSSILPRKSICFSVLNTLSMHR